MLNLQNQGECIKMKKILLGAVSLIITVAMLVSVCSIGSLAAETTTDCGGDCEYYPTIIIPGLGQSSVCVTDDDGNFILNDEGKVAVCIQPPQDDNFLPTMYVPCHRNGRKSWITGWNLTRRAKYGKVSDFNEKMRTFSTWGNLAEELANKTVVCIDVRQFVLTDWKTNTEIIRPCPILEYKH